MTTMNNQTTNKQSKQLLWINKIFKFPTILEDDMQNELPKVICTLSQEFANHRSQLKVSLQPCNHGSSHKKVTQPIPLCQSLNFFVV